MKWLQSSLLIAGFSTHRCCSLAWTSILYLSFRVASRRRWSSSRISFICLGRPSSTFIWRCSRGGAQDAYESGIAVSAKSTSSLLTSYSTSHSNLIGSSTSEEIDRSALEALVSTSQTEKVFGGVRYTSYKDPNLFRVVFVLGGPGAGKGTQSALIESHYPVCHLSVGDLLRNVPESSPHCEYISTALVSGQIVPVEISLSLLHLGMQKEVNELGNQMIFLVDGFPRNFDNLRGWCDIMRNVSVITSILVYTCPLKILEDRILQRAKASKRSDDNLETLQKRFQTFERETLPVINTLKAISSADLPSSWKVEEIQGNQELEAVWRDTQSIMNSLILNDVLQKNAQILQAVHDGNSDSYQDLCDPEWFYGRGVDETMRKQEGEAGTDTSVSNAQVDFMSGTHVAVSYDRVLQGQRLKEKRIWSHQKSRGWRNVHFYRIPYSNTTEDNNSLSD